MSTTAIRPPGDPALAKFNPLDRILCFDRFSSTTHGWTELIGNYDGRGDLDTVDDHMRDFRPPQLSSCSFFDVGTHGTLSGDYALKLATRPHKGHTATGIRRLTMAGRGRVRIETYFAFKAEAVVGAELPSTVDWDGNRHPAESQFGAFTVATDICADNGIRYHNVLRYQNTNLDGELTRQWMYPVVPEPTPRDHQEGRFALPYAADFTAPDPDDWRYLTDPQELCVNEVPTKINWHYLRWEIDTATRSNVEFQLNDRVVDMRDVPVPVYPDRYSTLDNLLNFYFSVRTHAAIRNFLFLDSVLISVDW
ncbi:hypothetical protein FPZ12_030970 [Amycolatopsis acidicola]|uniref:Uncharacterized protein n=1 Tax=Amycolatopsis acidicola TaxID=2596893 RepID=A0A5N0UT44_9PSEU|nr:DUF6772 family protein [Amycolatopsis acidicola]KAA9154948.1 hypothetical protein FPZ12_030970 [Amycolatopsis acidicola]